MSLKTGGGVLKMSLNPIDFDLFFDVKRADAHGLVAIGGEWNALFLTQAYERGVFPWPQEGLPILWFCPSRRGVIDFNEVHQSCSYKKFIKKRKWQIKINHQFEQIIRACQTQKRPDQEGTWILPEMIPAYEELFRQNKIICVGVYDQERLIGGIYGVLSSTYFSAESMFHRESGASKLAFYSLVDFLKNNLKMSWMDIQMVTSITESFGGKYLSRKEFLKRL